MGKFIIGAAHNYGTFFVPAISGHWLARATNHCASVVDGATLVRNDRPDPGWHGVDETGEGLFFDPIQGGVDNPHELLHRTERAVLVHLPLDDAPQVLNGVQVGALGWPGQKLDLMPFEPPLRDARDMARGVVLLEHERAAIKHIQPRLWESLPQDAYIAVAVEVPLDGQHRPDLFPAKTSPQHELPGCFVVLLTNPGARRWPGLR